MELSFDFLIADKIEKGKIPREPASPKERIEFMKKYFKKQIAIQDAIPLYVFFKRVPGLPKSRVGEFRKNVALNVKMPNEIVIINMEKLAEYSEVLDRFVNVIKTFA